MDNYFFQQAKTFLGFVFYKINTIGIRQCGKGYAEIIIGKNTFFDDTYFPAQKVE